MDAGIMTALQRHALEIAEQQHAAADDRADALLRVAALGVAIQIILATRGATISITEMAEGIVKWARDPSLGLPTTDAPVASQD